MKPAIALVQKDAVESFKEAVGKHRRMLATLQASIIIVEVAGGNSASLNMSEGSFQ